MKQIFSSKYKTCILGKNQRSKQYQLPSYLCNVVIFDVDCIYNQSSKTSGEHCDDFIFFDVDTKTTGIYLVERKTNIEDLPHIVEQLQGGANIIDKFLQNDEAANICKYIFMPIIVSKKKPSRTFARALLRAEISLNGVGKNDRKKLIHHVVKKSTFPNILK